MRLSGAQAAKLLHADRGLLDTLLPCVVPWIVTTEAKGESNFHWNPGRLLRRGDRCARCGRAGGNWRRVSKGPSRRECTGLRQESHGQAWERAA